jgi:hypothetical protein
VRLRAAATRGLEAVTDLDALDGLDAHQGSGQARVELAIPVDVGAQTRGKSIGDHLDDAAQRVAVLAGGVDLSHHRGRCVGADGADRVGVEALDVVRGRQRAGPVRRGPDGDGVRHEPDAIGLLEEPGRHLSEGDPGRRLPCGGSLEDRPCIGMTVLLHADEVGVAGTRSRQRLVARELLLCVDVVCRGEGLGAHRVRAHDRGPLGPLAVADADGDG